MQNNLKWTIGIVNFHTIDFIKHQLKITFELNRKGSFEIIIVDNSTTSEEKALIELSSKYPNVKIIRNDKKPDPWMRGSGQHGEGLDIILKETKSEYLLLHDPDFFWVKDNYLNILEAYLDDGNLCVGAPYRNYNGHDETGGIGPIDYPAAFGAAYRVSSINNNSFLPAVDKETYESSNGACWLKKDGQDVGWEIRDTLESEKYFSFFQKENKIISCLGSYSYEMVPYEYSLLKNDTPIAYHLFRGSFGDDVMSIINKGIVSKNASIEESRERYGKYFYYLAKSSQSKIYLPVAKLIIPYHNFIKNGNFLDIILHYTIYLPLNKILSILSSSSHKFFLFIGKILYVLTHPVNYIKSKIIKNKIND